MPESSFDDMMPEIVSFARRIFDAGRKAERNRLFGLLQGSEGADTISLPGAAERRSRIGGKTGRKASVSDPVREALRALSATSPSGADTAEVAAYLDAAESGLTGRQVRAALKNLHSAGEAIRTTRGRYLSRDVASAQPAEEDPDAGTSGIFSLAAE